MTRRFAEKAASIDAELLEARSRINWERRKEAESDIVKWVNTYCIGVFLDDPPPPKGEEILREMYRATVDSRPYLLLQARGSGKTSYVECIVSFLIATGRRKFPVIISQNATSAQNILSDIFRIIQDMGTFSEDYPDVSLPFQLCNGSYRRRQTYNGVQTEISKTSSKLVLARLVEKDENGGNVCRHEAPTSGSVIATRGVGAGIRGMKQKTLRPDVAVLDDIQDDEVAESPEQVEKVLSIINKSVLNVGGKGKVAVLQTATPIAPEDLVDRLSHDKAWKVTKYPAIIRWPDYVVENSDTDKTDKTDKTGKNGLWRRYFELYDEENATDSPHTGEGSSLEFYVSNREAMDRGAEVLNPNRFKESDGHVSGLQALMDKFHQIGEEAFMSEYMMSPKALSTELMLTPRIVASRVDPAVGCNRIPDGFNFSCAAIDVNPSYAATVTALAFKPDSTSAVVFHKTYRLSIDQSLTPVVYNQTVYDALTRIVKDLKARKVPMDALGVDCGGRNWDAVCLWASSSARLLGVPSCAMAGRSAVYFNPLARNRLRNAVGRTLLCGDDRELIKKGSGRKWLFFDSDFFKEKAQRSFLSETGSPGSCSLYHASAAEHTDFCVQVCNERLRRRIEHANGKTEYDWLSKDPHDFLDCLAMCHAIAENQGLSQKLVTPVPRIRRAAIRRRVRVV